MKEIERLFIIKDGVKEMGFLDGDKNLVKLDDMVNHIAINIVQSLFNIQHGEKKTEETNIELEISALNSLSNAVNALANYAKTFH